MKRVRRQWENGLHQIENSLAIVNKLKLFAFLPFYWKICFWSIEVGFHVLDLVTQTGSFFE